MKNNMSFFGGGQNSPKKVANQAQNTIMGRAEVEARINSVIQNMVRQGQEIMQQVESMRSMLKTMHLRTESFMAVANDKGLVTNEEWEASKIKTEDRIDAMVNDLFNRQHGLTVIGEPAIAGDIAYIQFTVLDATTGVAVDENRKINLPLEMEKLPLTQLKVVAKDIVGKSSGDVGDLQFEIPKEETANIFAGMKVSLQYKILEIKRAIPAEAPPAEGLVSEGVVTQ